MQTRASQPAPNRSVELSQKLYQQLLWAYPRSHREEYGGAMLQLFRDQCRDAWTEGRTWGLAVLWVRILPDLVKTSFLERWSNFSPGKFMTNTFNALRPRKFPAFVFFAVFFIVFLLTLIVVTAITFILPETYASTARIKLEPEPPFSNPASSPGALNANTQIIYPFDVQTVLEVMESQLVLSNVVSSLNLNETWGRKYYAGNNLKTTESMDLLRHQLGLNLVKNTRLIGITAYSNNKYEAAQLANAVGEAYKEYRITAYASAVSNNITPLEQQFRQQEAHIEQLQSEKDVLARKFNISEDMSADLLRSYQSQLIDGERTFQELKTQLQQLQALAPNQLRDTLPTITGDGALTELLEKMHDADQQFASLANDYAPADMHIVRVKSTMKEINSEIDARVAGIMEALQSEVNSKQAAVESLDELLRNRKPTAENQPYWDKKSELDQLLAFHHSIETKLNEQKLLLLNPPVMVEFTDVAQPGDAPVKPNKTLDITFGAILGLFLGALAGSLAAFITSRLGKRKPVSGMV